jgi:hypothetical protein
MFLAFMFMAYGSAASLLTPPAGDVPGQQLVAIAGGPPHIVPSRGIADGFLRCFPQGPGGETQIDRQCNGKLPARFSRWAQTKLWMFNFMTLAEPTIHTA